MCCTLSSYPWGFPVPSPFSSNRNLPASELDRSLEIIQPLICSWRKRPGEGRGLHLATQLVGAELKLEPKASEPARGFPVLQADSCLLSYLVSSCLISLRIGVGEAALRWDLQIDFRTLLACTVYHLRQTLPCSRAPHLSLGVHTNPDSLLVTLHWPGCLWGLRTKSGQGRGNSEYTKEDGQVANC